MPAPIPNLDERGLPRDYSFHPEWEITPRQLVALRGERAVLVVDCRTDQERAICRIDDSMHVPLHEIERKLDDLRDRADELDGSGAAPIVIHCHHGMRSLRATAVLRAAGFANVHSLAGGIHLWAVDVQPGMATY